MNNPTFTRQEVLDRLRQGPATVVFTKVSGERREMKCTLEASHIPKELTPKGTSGKEFSPDIIRAFDLDKNEWRSFRLDSLISLK